MAVALAPGFMQASEAKWSTATFEGAHQPRRLEGIECAPVVHERLYGGNMAGLAATP
jgi:hypothetical protein